MYPETIVKVHVLRLLKNFIKDLKKSVHPKTSKTFYYDEAQTAIKEQSGFL